MKQTRQTMVHERPVIGSHQTPQDAVIANGQGEHSAHATEGRKGVSGRLWGRGDRPETPRAGSVSNLAPAAPRWTIPLTYTDSRNLPPHFLTDAERLTVQAAIETEIYSIRKQSAADFRHGRVAILRDCLALPCLDAAARARLADCPLPTKAEVVGELRGLLETISGPMVGSGSTPGCDPAQQQA